MDRLRHILLTACLWCALAVAACGTDTPSTSGPEPDAADAAADTAADTRDAGALDTAPDTESPDVSPDVAADAAVDTDPDAPSPDAGPTSRCEVTAETIRCDRNTAVFDNGFGDYEEREVHWQVPVGETPSKGWPVAILFQGSLYSSEYYWEGEEGAAMGMFYRARVLQVLLDAGFAVITPEAHLDGSTYWDSNLPAWSTNWDNAPDHHLMLDIFGAIERGEFGEIDPDKMFAAGISSGGYMTSRMAVAYPGRFTALAIHSASYAWCGGWNCWVPSLPDDHPPTLFLHGRLDNIVPVWTMTPYEDDLSDQGTPTRIIIDESAGHEWIEQAPDAILQWFETYL